MNTWRIAVMSVLFFSFNVHSQDDDLMKRIEMSNKINQVFDVAKEARLVSELEIVGKQIEGLKRLKDEYLQKVKMIQKQTEEKTKGLSKEETRQFTSRVWKEVQLATVGKIDRILLPHQIKRLNQIATQRRVALLARGDRFDLIVALAQKIDLTKSELESFKKHVRSERKKYEQNLRELIKQTDNRVLKHLSPKARRKLDQMVGEIY